MVWSQERVHRVPHTLLHRFSSSLERPRALHPLRRAALSKIQPFLGRSTNRRQLTKASYVSVSSTTRCSPPFFCVASRVRGLFFISSSFLLSFLLFNFSSAPSLIRWKVRDCTDCRYSIPYMCTRLPFSSRNSISFTSVCSVPECLLRFLPASLYGRSIARTRWLVCSTRSRGFPRSYACPFSLAFGAHDCSSLNPLHFRLLFAPSTSTASSWRIQPSAANSPPHTHELLSLRFT